MSKQADEELRIGVFVCDCGTNIAGFLDVPDVCEYAKTLPNVEYVQENMYTCSEAGLTEIKTGIKEHNLNKIIVASCTPRTHGPLFMAACEQAGVNKYLFEFANIRDQCSWVHMKEWDNATKKAKDLIRMAVARASLLEPKEEFEIDVFPATLVIGGGISGMTSAISLANQGFDVHLIEKKDKLGGMLNKLYKLYPTDVKPNDIINNLINKIKTHKKIKVYLNCELKKIGGYIGNFDIDLMENGKEENFKVGTIIVATGAIERNPENLYEYNQNVNIITQMELEKMLKNEELKRPNSIAMIQCVGARGQGVTYCSRICCMIAIKNAKLIKEMWPDCDVYILHRDIQAYGSEYEEYYRETREKGVRFIRFEENNIPKISFKDKKLNVNVHHSLLNRDMNITTDYIVLSSPLIQNPDAKELAQMLKVPLGQDKFFFEAHVKLRPLDFATDGIYLCGTAHAPADIIESIQQAYGAASRAAIPMAKSFVKPEALFPIVDSDLCQGCGICEMVCPYGALKVIDTEQGRRAEVIPASCKGCGCCGSSCIWKAIKMQHYSDEQLSAQSLAGLEEV